MNAKDIEQRASEMVADKIRHGYEVHMDWTVRELILSMGDIDGKGAEFHAICAHEYAWRVVKRVVKKYDAESEEAEASQMTLDGFEQLRVAYTMPRKGETQLIPLHKLTDDEIRNRAATYIQQSKTLKKHAKELLYYLYKRESVAA